MTDHSPGNPPTEERRSPPSDTLCCPRANGLEVTASIRRAGLYVTSIPSAE